MMLRKTSLDQSCFWTKPSEPELTALVWEITVSLAYLGDFNSDGWLEVYLLDPNGPNLLHRNKVKGEFEISPLSNAASLPDRMSSGAALAGLESAVAI